MNLVNGEKEHLHFRENNTWYSFYLSAHSNEMGKKGVCLSAENLLAAVGRW